MRRTTCTEPQYLYEGALFTNKKMGSDEEEAVASPNFAKAPERQKSIANESPYSRNTVLKSMLQ